MSPKISIIIVNYHAHRELFACLASLPKSSEHEIIIVDNDETPIIKPKLIKLYPQSKYIQSPRNIGFGAGCNLGATLAVGRYLFFLNPDTRVLAGSLDKLANYLNSHLQVGVVGPLLLDSTLKPYPWVGTQDLTPLQGFIALSFINHLWPNNPVSKSYWVHTSNLSTPTSVGVIPGTALMVRSAIFHQISGFDEQFFLYFEESDLCRRIHKLNQEIYLIPEAKVVHFWGKSTNISPEINKIFASSRFYYFRKHFGFFWAILVESVCRFSPKVLLGIK